MRIDLAFHFLDQPGFDQAFQARLPRGFFQIHEGFGEPGNRRFFSQCFQAVGAGRTVEKTEQPQDRQLALALFSFGFENLS